MNDHFVASYFDFSALPIDFVGKQTLWGVSPVSPLHLGYDALFGMQSQLCELGAKPRTLLADVHAMMSHGLSKNDVVVRASYYDHVLRDVFSIDTEVILGSGFEYTEGYTAILYKTMQHFTVGQSKQAAGATKKNTRDTIDRYVYPLMQCVDAAILGPDIIVAERSQEKIYRLMRSMADEPVFDSICAWLSSVHIVYVESTHDLNGERMQNSSRHTRISYHDEADVVEAKVRKMFAPPEAKQQGEKGNPLLVAQYPFSEGGVQVLVAATNGREPQWRDIEGRKMALMPEPQSAVRI